MSATGRRVTADALASFELRLALRGRAPLVGALVFGVAAAVVALVGVTTFRRLGLGAVTPAAMGLLELSVTLPALVAMVVGAAAFHGDGDAAFRAMLRAAGARPAALVLGKMWGIAATAAVTVLAGYGVAALALAGTLTVRDLAPFTFLLIVTLLVTVACGAIGVLISALARERAGALLGAIGIWALFAIGIDLVVIGLAPALRCDGLVLALAAVADPIEAARIAGLLALGADAHVLGGVGAYVSGTLGAGTAVLALLTALGLWTVLPLVAARAAITRRDR